MKGLSFFTKKLTNIPFSYHTLSFYVYALKLIHGLESYLARKDFIL